MSHISVLHTADLHLSSAMLGLPPKVGGQRRRDIMQTLAKTVETCKQNDVDLLLISGDLWQQKYVTRPLVDFVADQFQRIPETKVVIAPGQADCYQTDNFYSHYPWPDNVHIFSSPQLASLSLPQLKVQIYGCAWTDQPRDLDWTQVVDNADPDSQTIIIAYGDPNTLDVPDQVLALDNLAYVALGGNHRHRTWSKKMVDSGCPEPLDIGDTGKRGVLLGSIGKGNCSMEFVSLNSRRYYSLQINISGCTSIEQVSAAVTKVVSQRQPQTNIFIITLLGKRFVENWDLTRVEDAVEAFHIYWLDETEAKFDLESLASEHSKGVVGKYIRAVDKSAGEKDVKKLALQYGLESLLAGRDMDANN